LKIGHSLWECDTASGSAPSIKGEVRASRKNVIVIVVLWVVDGLEISLVVAPEKAVAIRADFYIYA
jgi:hypothetical protein